MDFLKIFVFFTLIIGLTFSSCTKDPIDETEIIEQDPVDTENTITNNLLTNIRTSGDEGMELDCITILYTFDMVLEDDSEVSIASEDDFWDLFSDSLNFPVDFIYPLNVLNAEGDEVHVEDAIGLGELFAACVPDSGWVSEDDWVPAFILDENCFQFVYPVELFNEFDEDFVANSIEEFIDLTSTNNVLFYSWPLELTDDTGEIYIVNSATEFFELMYSCEDYYNPCDSNWYEDDSLFFGLEFIACYEIVFPITVIDESGDEVTLENADAMMSFVFNGHFFLDYVYPFNVLDFEGNIIEVTDELFLHELLEDCWEGPNGSGLDFAILLWSNTQGAVGEDACYHIEYPVTAIYNDSTTVEINTDEELFEAISFGELVEILVPVNVIMIEDGTEIEIDDEEDLFEILEDCSWNNGGGSGDNYDFLLFLFSTAAAGDSACFEILYPITVELWDSTYQDITSDDEFVSFMESGQMFYLEYPLTVALLNDNSEFILNEPEDLIELVESCQ